MLSVWIGRARSGKSEAVLRRIAELGDESRQILLVPEHASHQAEVDLCASCGDTVSRHAEVLSFRRLGDRVLSRNAAGQVTLDNGGKILTLQCVLTETAPLLRTYRRPSQKAAFLEQMCALFDGFHSYEITPEQLMEK
ncbi:MAG: ATP-dependent nuclease subunit B, partial [Oscillibacter sp.]|nr:ATP-dependent nuclease subunit B [Oscillibacter sp.]